MKTFINNLKIIFILIRLKTGMVSLGGPLAECIDVTQKGKED